MTTEAANESNSNSQAQHVKMHYCLFQGDYRDLRVTVDPRTHAYTITMLNTPEEQEDTGEEFVRDPETGEAQQWINLSHKEANRMVGELTRIACPELPLPSGQ